MKILWISKYVLYLCIYTFWKQAAYNPLLFQMKIMFIFFHFSHVMRYTFFRTRNHFFTPKVTVIDLITVNAFSNNDGDFVNLFL